MVEQERGENFSYLVRKGVNNYAVHVMSEALKFAGRQRVLIMSDGEPAIRALIDTVARLLLVHKGSQQLRRSRDE